MAQLRYHFFEMKNEGCFIYVKVTARASRDAFRGLCLESVTGKQWLHVAVRACPIEGKANKAVQAFLAKEWELAKGQLVLRSGATSKNKVFLVQGDSDAVVLKLAAWCQRLEL